MMNTDEKATNSEHPESMEDSEEESDEELSEASGSGSFYFVKFKQHFITKF